MSSDIINNQVMKDASASVAQASGLPGSKGKRQDVAAVVGTKLPPAKAQSAIAEESQQEISAEKVKEVVEQLNNHAQAVNRDLQFSVDDESGRTVIKVINSETAELVRQIPSEEVLRLSQTIRETIEGNKGIIVQTSA